MGRFCTTLRIILAILNGVLLIAFGAITILGMLIRFEEAYLMNLLAQITAQWPSSEVHKFIFLIRQFGSATAIGLILIGLLLSAIALTGTLALCCEVRGYGMIYLIAIALLSVAELALIIYLFAIPGNLMMSVDYLLSQTLIEIPGTSDFGRASQTLWNMIGSTGKDFCCGLRGYMDFAGIPSSVSFPLPCCELNFTNSHGQSLFCTGIDAAQKNITGCNEKVANFVERYTTLFIAIPSSVLTFQVVVFIITCILCYRWKYTADYDDDDGDNSANFIVFKK